MRLGLRLALADGVLGLLPSALAAIAVAAGTAILLYAVAFPRVLAVRYDHDAWRQSGTAVGASTPRAGLLMVETHDYLLGRSVVRVDVAPLSADAPIPPGIPALPASGRSYISPALRSALAAAPGGSAADRYGQVVGIVGEAALGGPDELLVIHGLSLDQLLADQPRLVTAFATHGSLPAFSFIIGLILAIAVVGALAPVAVFVATAARLAAGRRERRLAALRLSGATPAQVATLAALDSLVTTIPGSALGLLAFLVLRPLVATVPLNGMSWFPDAIAVTVPEAVALLAAVPIVGMVASAWAVRRMSITPLGVARRSTPPPPTRLRIVPLVASLIALALSLSVGPTLLRAIVIEVVAVSFLGVILGIVIAGPWFTAAVGRALASSGGAVRLLAGRRLLDDPRASFLSVAGVVMAVFVATTFFGFQSSVTHAIQAVSLPTLDTTVYAEVRPGDAQAAGASAGTLASVPGVRAVALVRVATLVGANASPQMVWIAPCRDLVATLRLPHVDCGPGLIHLVGKGTVPASARLMPATTTAPAGDAAPESGVAVPSGVAVDRLLVGPWPGDARTNPVAIVEPAVAGADLTAFATERVLVGTDGDPVTIERARTIIETAAPTSGPATTAELLRTVTRTFSELGWVISLGVLMTMLVAGFGLAVALVGGLLDRRRPFALLRLTGVPVDRLQRVVLLEAAAPLAVVAAVSGVLGVLVSQLVLRLVGVPQVALPDASLVVLLVASVGGAIALSVAALPLVEPVTSLQETRFE